MSCAPPSSFATVKDVGHQEPAVALLAQLAEEGRPVREEHGLIRAPVDDLRGAGREERRDAGAEQLRANDDDQQRRDAMSTSSITKTRRSALTGMTIELSRTSGLG